MKAHYQVLAFAGLVVAAACANSAKDSGAFGQSGNGTSTGSVLGGVTGSQSLGGTGNSSLGGGTGATSGTGAVLLDSGATLGSNGSGSCVTGRTACDAACDELVEMGQHEYVEQHPDDGSKLPAADVATLFAGTPSTTGGPCIVEPPDGALFPNNWARARIRVKSPTPNSIFQIRISTARQTQPLVVYTASPTWKIPKDVWQALAASTWGEDITVKVSAVGSGGGQVTSSTVKFQIAPANANGSMIYWATVGKTAGESWLEGFGVGDENVAVALTVPQVGWDASLDERGQKSMRGASPGAVSCIGCHVAAPDRQSVVFNDNWPWNGVSSMVDPADTGKVPSWLTPGGKQAIGMPWIGMMSFSPHVWNDLNQHIVVAAFQADSQFPTTFQPDMFPDGGAPQGVAPWGYQGSNEWDVSPRSHLAWIDLSTSAPVVTGNADQLSVGMAGNEGTSWGIIPRNGDTLGAATPTWSHAGDTVVYTSTDASQSGRLNIGTAHLWSVPFNAKAGGTATAIQGASEAGYNEYFPAFSPDDKYIAFNRTPAADKMYYAANGEIAVIPAAGGTRTRLVANDSPTCSGAKSPGSTNSWAKWSPEYPACSGKTYYWLIFSSAREGVSFVGQGEVTSQLYLTALVDDGTGTLTSYPGIYIWNQHTKPTVAPYDTQNLTQSNHTPQWEPIDLPVPPPPPPPPTPPR